MVAKHKTIMVSAASELALTLKAAQASGSPVVIDTGEGRYTLIVALTEMPREIFARYDAQAAIAGLQALDEALAGVDREQLLRDLRTQRAQNSAGRSG